MSVLCLWVMLASDDTMPQSVRMKGKNFSTNRPCLCLPNLMARVTCPFRPSRIPSLSLLLVHCALHWNRTFLQCHYKLLFSLCLVSSKTQFFLYWQVLMFTFKGRKHEFQVQAKFLNIVLWAMQCSEYFNSYLAP